MDFNRFSRACQALPLYRSIPQEFADAIIQEVFLESDFIKAHNLFQTCVRRFQDRVRNLLSGKTVTLRILDERLHLLPPQTSLEDWMHPSCDINYFTYTEAPPVTSQSLGAAISKLSSQQSRHYNALFKELCPDLCPEVQALFLEANAIAIDLRSKKRRKNG